MMLAMLIGLAVFMLFAVNSPAMSAKFVRPEGFYDDIFGKVGMALLFAGAVAFVVEVVRRFLKR
ncbi:hypothetical protein [Croceicoccus sediminis]|uniref:hypothetical protein n=1 Tax=Croceicoccus sediminis TaxID=2571150 RepID=UPI00196A68B9|nr:hypothetical protein [Croceicoccus sediminis]